MNQSAGTVNVNGGWMSIGLGSNGGNTALDASKYRITGGQLNVPFFEIGADRGGTLDISGTAAVNVNGSSLAVGLRAGGNGTVSLSGGSLNLGNNTGFIVGRESGSTGLVQQTGGSVTAQVNAAGIFSIGDQAGSTGTYNLQAGSMAQMGGAFIGNNGTGTFNVSGGTASFIGIAVGLNGQGGVNQTGGSITSSNWLDVGVAADPSLPQAQYLASGGAVSVGSLNIGLGHKGRMDVSGTAQVSAGSLNVGRDAGGEGVINQVGGSLVISGGAFIGNNSPGTLKISGGTASFQGVVVGASALGVVNQTGGNVTSSNWVDVGTTQDVALPEAQYLASGGTLTANTITVGVGHKGRLAVSGTAQVAASTLIVGGNTDGDGVLTQSDGTITAGDVLMSFQAGTAALFSHTGGTLDTIRLQLGGGSTTPRFTTTGDVNVGVGAAVPGKVNIHDNLGVTGGTFKAGGNFIVLPTGTVSLAPGGDLNIRNGVPVGTATAGNIDIVGTLVTIDGHIFRPSIGTGRTRIGVGATLNGTGVIDGPLTILAGGTLAPGHSAGVLTSGDFSLLAGGHLSLEIGGVTVESQHDAVAVTGTVTLAGDLLGSALINGYTGTLGDTIYAIYNDGSDPVIGTFFNGALPVPEGGTVAISGLRFAVHYAANADGGAVGNDVALVRVVPEPGALPSLLAALAFAGRRRGFFRQRAA